MKNKYFITLVLVGLVMLSGAQEFDFLNYSESLNVLPTKNSTVKHSLLNEIDTPILKDSLVEKEYKSYSPINKSNSLIKDIDFSLSIGSQIGVASKNRYFASTFIAPSVKFKLSNKFSIQTGIGYSYGLVEDYLLFNHESRPNGSMINVNNLFAYVSAIYSVNDKTSILASGVINQQMNMFNNGQVNHTYTDLSLGINYKITSNFSVNAQVNVGNNPNNNTFFTPGGIHMNPNVGF